MGKALLTHRHLLNAFFRSPSQLDVRTGGSQQKLTAHFAFSSIHKLNFLVDLSFLKSDKDIPYGRNIGCFWMGGDNPGKVKIAGNPFLKEPKVVRIMCTFRRIIITSKVIG